MNRSNVLLIGVFLMVISFSLIPVTFAWHAPSNLPKSVVSVSNESSDSDNSGLKGFLTRPTFGLSHENNQRAVDYGFKLNDKKFFLSDNFHTPFVEQPIRIGERNTFEAMVFSEKGLHVQEFLFGVPEVGEAHKAELGIEVWLGYDGIIENIKAIQETDVIDADHVIATHEKIKCRSNSSEEKCDSIRISLMFLEPLKHQTMAIKAIDFKNRYQITYLNEGIDVLGESLNPMQTAIIPSPERNEGLIEVTQSKKYSVIWTTEDGRVFERNTFGSFRQIIDSFERFQDLGEPRNRHHSAFGNLLEKEKDKAFHLFNATNLESELPDTFAYSFPEENQRIDDKVKAKMLEQERIAQEIIEKSNIQQRFSNINS